MDPDPVLQSNSRWIKGHRLRPEQSQPGGECPRPSGGTWVCFLRGTQGPPGSAGSTGLTVHFPGKLLELNAGGKEPKRKAGRSSGGESVDPCVRGAAAGLPGGGVGGWGMDGQGDGWMDGWMDGRSPPPGDGPPPSAMKWWGRCSWPPLPSQPRSPWERLPQGAALDLHAGARRGNRAEASELIGGEQWSVALPVRDMCLFRVHRGPSGRPPPWAPGPHCPVSVGASVQPRLGSEPPFPSAGAHVRPAGGPVSNGSHPALSQR